MKLRWLDIALIVLCLWGGYVFMRVQAQLSELRQENARIVAAVGDMVIDDPTIMHVKAIETGKPLSWTWRIHEPDSLQGTMRYKIGSSGSSGSYGFSSQQQQYLARISLTPAKAGNLAIYTHFLNSSGLASFASKEFTSFLMEHRDELIVEQMGKQSVEQIQRGAPASLLLRLSLPDKLAEQALQQFPNDAQYIPVLLEMTIEIP